MPASDKKAWGIPQIRRLFTLTAPLVLSLGIVVLHKSRILPRVENMLVDIRFQWRADSDPPAHPDLLLVAIDEISLDAENGFGGWPWARTVHGDLIQLLVPSQPAALAFDLLFTEPRDPQENDQYFGDVAKELPGVITAAKRAHDETGSKPADLGPTRPLRLIEGNKKQIFGSDRALFPIPPLRANSLFAFVDSEPSSQDGIRRHQPLMIRAGSDVFPSLSLQALMVYLGAGPNNVSVRLGKELVIRGKTATYTVPIDKHGRMLINYRADEKFTQLSYVKLVHQLMATHMRGEAWPADYPKIRGQMLFVGQTASGLTDLGPNPMKGSSPLVLTHLNTINSILKGDYLRKVNGLAVWFVWLGLVWGSLFALREASVFRSTAWPAAITVAYTAAAFALFIRSSILLPIAWPVGTFVACHAIALTLRWLEEREARENLKGIFATYVSAGVMEQLLADPENIQLGGTRKPVTIFFSDIRDFTSISEGGDEQKLVAQLNEYFEQMVSCIAAKNGTLHKYIGDAIMALWGDILSSGIETDARAAVEACLDMRRALHRLNGDWERRGIIPVRIGMGVNHGTVCVGNIGAPQRKEFTAIGDAVNLASRLEGVTKKFGTDLIVSDTVHDLLDGSFVCRPIGRLIVKGKSKPVGTFEVLGKQGDTDIRYAPGWLDLYRSAFDKFLARDFSGAAALFDTCLEQEPHEKTTALYRHYCDDYRQTPPPPDWMGDIKLDSK